MNMNNEIKKHIESALVRSDLDLEDFLEQFDVSPEDTVFFLYSSGMIDTELFERLYAVE